MNNKGLRFLCSRLYILSIATSHDAVLLLRLARIMFSRYGFWPRKLYIDKACCCYLGDSASRRRYMQQMAEE
jgi:hypothetical protein